MTLLATTPTPNGNFVELHDDDGAFTTRLYALESTHEITEEQAREWYAVAGSCGGRSHASFPETRP